jgi:hypothetical protein
MVDRFLEGALPAGSRVGTATAAKSGTTVTVEISGIVTTVQVARDLSVSSGDVVVLLRYGGLWVAVARLWAAAPASTFPAAPPAPQPPATSGVLTVAPVETRTYQSGSWRTDNDGVYQGEYGGTGLRTGVAFYGGQPRSLAGATVTGATLAVRREQGGDFAARTSTLWLVTQSTRPGGAPTRSSSTTGPTLGTQQQDTAFQVPAAFGQALVDGTAGALAVYDADGSPYMVLAGRSRWSPAFTLSIYWRR